MPNHQRCALLRQTAQGGALPAAGQSSKGEQDKVIRTLQARAALLGCTLHLLDDRQGGVEFLVVRWNLSRTLPTIQAVEQFLDQMGGRHG